MRRVLPDRPLTQAEIQRRYRERHPGRSNEFSRRCMAKRRANDPERQRAYMRSWLYGLSAEAYETMLQEQNGKCGICLDVMAKPQVDHDHETDEVRGLLCARCNVGLGALGDTIESLERALGYLRNASVALLAREA